MGTRSARSSQLSSNTALQRMCLLVGARRRGRDGSSNCGLPRSSSSSSARSLQLRFLFLRASAHARVSRKFSILVSLLLQCFSAFIGLGLGVILSLASSPKDPREMLCGMEEMPDFEESPRCLLLFFDARQEGQLPEEGLGAVWHVFFGSSYAPQFR